MYLLDANVVSELRKVRGGNANPGVGRWAKSVVSADLYLSVVSLEELEIGALLRTWLGQHVHRAVRGSTSPTRARSATPTSPQRRWFTA